MRKKLVAKEPLAEFQWQTSIKVGDEVWVRARVVEVPKKGTIGGAHGMLRCAAITHGLNQDQGDPQIICTDLTNVRRV